MASATREDVDAAVASPAHAYARGEWANADPLDRAQLMNLIADKIDGRIDELAALDAAMTGWPIREMRAQMGRLPEWWRNFAGIARGLEGRVIPFKRTYLNHTQFTPPGVVVAIAPWNQPLLILVKKLAPALAAGNCVVSKRSELATLRAIAFAQIVTEAGVPHGVLNM